MEQRTATEIAKESELHGTEYKVLLILFGRMEYDNCASVTQKYIAHALGIEQPQVSKAIKKLLACGAISKEAPTGIIKYRINVSSRGNKTKE